MTFWCIGCHANQLSHTRQSKIISFRDRLIESRQTAGGRGLLGRDMEGLRKKKKDNNKLMEMDNSVMIAGIGRWGAMEEGKGG